MTEKQTVEIVTTICMSYPSFEKLGADAIKGMVKIWAMLFADDDYSLVQLAVAKHISTSKWPPAVAEIREQMVQISHPELVPPDMAWRIVQDAKAALGQFPDRDKLAAIMPPLVLEAVNNVGWQRLWQLCDPKARGVGANTDKLAFMDFYKPVYERERERLMLPQSIRARMVGTSSMLEPARRLRAEREETLRKLLGNSLESGDLPQIGE